MKSKANKSHTTLSTFNPQKITQENFDPKFIEMAISAAFHMIQSTKLAPDNHDVMSDYQHIQYAIDMIHTYLYDKKNSHLKEQDAQIFAQYLVQKMKDFQKVIDKISNKE
jgi:hypothetical protein